jgi:hypothetical protein
MKGIVLTSLGFQVGEKLVVEVKCLEHCFPMIIGLALKGVLPSSQLFQVVEHSLCSNWLNEAELKRYVYLFEQYCLC